MPKTKPEPTADPAEDEAPDADVKIEFRGQTFTVPRDVDDWPTTAWIARLEASTTNRTLDWLRFVELLLGPVQWQTLSLAAPTRGDFVAFLDEFTPTVTKECAL
jgi:hypothetical protein